ncbi:MAG: hypothetical protein RMJ87_12415 [Cytophagales bacterium]|nr:hypothetical protein [Bernardetiaceae bacterium]MDW8205824.1 hypothetical protein [Cytophagales bacterium]
MLVNYLRYLLSAKTLHHIHSPFVYRLHSQIVLPRKQYYDFELLRQFFRPLTIDKTTISNLGAVEVSKFFFRPTVSAIIQNFEPSQRVAELLYKLVDFLHPQTILVAGCNAGVAIHYLAKGWHKSKLVGIEPCQPLAQLTEKTASAFSQVQILHADWQEGIQTAAQFSPVLDLIWLNTRHAESMYFVWKNCLPILHHQGAAVFHLRCRTSAMEQMWQQIIAEERVRFSIDLWEVGMVFIDNRQPKQHFVLRW